MSTVHCEGNGIMKADRASQSVLRFALIAVALLFANFGLSPLAAQGTDWPAKAQAAYDQAKRLNDPMRYYEMRGNVQTRRNPKKKEMRQTFEALKATQQDFETMLVEGMRSLPSYRDTPADLQRWSNRYGKPIRLYTRAIDEFGHNLPRGGYQYKKLLMERGDHGASAKAADHFAQAIAKVVYSEPGPYTYNDFSSTTRRYFPNLVFIDKSPKLNTLARNAQRTRDGQIAARKRAERAEATRRRNAQIAAQRAAEWEANREQRERDQRIRAAARANDSKRGGGPAATASFGKITIGKTPSATARREFASLARQLVPGNRKITKTTHAAGGGSIAIDCYHYVMPYDFKRQMCLFTSGGVAAGMRFDGGGVNCGDCSELPIIRNFMDQGFVSYEDRKRNVKGMGYEVTRAGKGNLRMHYHRGLGITTTTKRRFGAGITAPHSSQTRRIGGICVFQYRIEKQLPRSMRCDLYP